MARFKSKPEFIKSKTKNTKINVPKLNKPNKYNDMSVDEFLEKELEAESSTDSEDKVEFEENSLLEGKDENSGQDSDNNGDPESETDNEAEEHIKSLTKLQQTDPEFYKFLKDNDKNLLEFNLSDKDDSDDEETENLHKPDAELQVASDESDFEDADEEKPRSSYVITLKMLKTWQNDIKTDKSSKTINILAQAFHAALMRVSAGEDDEIEDETSFKVEGSGVFNGVIQLCVLEFGPALRRFLGLSKESKQLPHKCKKFIKIKRTLKFYFTDLLKLLRGVTSANIQTVLLKHLHYISSMLVSFPNTAKSILKRLISIWGTADEGVRVVAFFCILRITRNQQDAYLDTVLKSMYMTFVKNSKFVSVGSLPCINFMRRSLVEMFCLDLNVAYQHVFLYVRQLAIHLRNAIVVKKKENIQAVYNWQFVNSLRLWANLLAVSCNKPQLQQLVYPLVQVSLGTIKLVPTAQYYPLRFHVVQALIELSKDTGVFIPVLPFILDVLNNYDFNKKHQKVSMKPLHFTCLLRASKSQLSENGFKDMLIETIYAQLLEYLTSQSHSVAFSDLSFVTTLQIKQFLKTCKNAIYNRKLKQVLEKIEENSKFIDTERRKVTFHLTDFKQIEGWETQIKNKGTPLSVYYENWNKVRRIKKKKEVTNNEELADYNLPTIKRRDAKIKESSGEKVVLFPSDSEDDSDVEVKKKRGKRGKKNKNVVDYSGPVEDSGEMDIVEDIDMEDW